jgi:hypothetical protein
VEGGADGAAPSIRLLLKGVPQPLVPCGCRFLRGCCPVVGQLGRAGSAPERYSPPFPASHAFAEAGGILNDQSSAQHGDQFCKLIHLDALWGRLDAGDALLTESESLADLRLGELSPVAQRSENGASLGGRGDSVIHVGKVTPKRE